MAKQPNRAERRRPLQEAYRLASKRTDQQQAAESTSVAGPSAQDGPKVPSSNQRRPTARLWLRSWISLSPRKPSRKKAKAAAIYKLFLDGAVAVLAWVLRGLAVPVVWRWLIWLACFAALLEILQDAIASFIRLPGKTRWLIKGMLTMAFCLSFCGTVRREWRTEQSAKLAGVLLVPRNSLPSMPIFEFGDSGAKLLWLGSGNLFQPMYDAGIALDRSMGSNGVELSTIIRDRFGNVVVTIEKNHWEVSPLRSACWDKNYTDNTLEVLDGRNHVVFQVRMLVDHVQLQGEWHDDIGRGLRIMKSPVKTRQGGLMLGLTPADQQIDYQITPIFMYPSSEHWGEFVVTQQLKQPTNASPRSRQ